MVNRSPELRQYHTSDEGRRCQEALVNHLVSKAPSIATVRDLIAGTGLRLLLLAETNKKDEPPLRASVVTERLAARLSGFDLAAGDAMLTYNPSQYFTVTGEDKKTAFQHALWHVFLSSAFPGFAADMVNLHLKTRESVPYFQEHFLDPYSHFFTRVAALEAGCTDYVIDDAALELEGRMPGINALKGRPCDLVQAAALFSGLLFSHVFSFALFSATGVRAMDNCKALRRLMEHFMSLDQIRQSEAFARDQLAGFRLGEDVDMGGHSQRVLTSWQQFATAVSRG